MIFKEQFLKDKNIIEEHLRSILPQNIGMQNNIVEAMNYSLHAGGKRLRPILFMETMTMLGKDYIPFMNIACSLELIHTYSLIHDDLPAMDDDDLRRGKPTNHKVFGEANAILAGDGLLNYSYELMLDFINKHPSLENARGCFEIAKSAGIHGMIGGQAVDISSENIIVDKMTMEFIHKHKTGALIEASMVSAAVISGASSQQTTYIKDYARKLGLIFQITDDILDITGNETILGKNIHSDTAKGKATYPKIYGMQESKNMAENISQSCIKDISNLGKSSYFFVELAKDILKRKN